MKRIMAIVFPIKDFQKGKRSIEPRSPNESWQNLNLPQADTSDFDPA